MLGSNRRRRSLPALLAAASLALCGCSQEEPVTVAVPGPTVTVTVTAEPSSTAHAVSGSSTAREEAAVEPLPKLRLRVFEDGCGVIRGRTPAGTTYQSLTWSVLDQGGFQVLQRNAEGETRYRYFQRGEFDVVLEAYHDGGYRPVSNRVTISC